MIAATLMIVTVETIIVIVVETINPIKVETINRVKTRVNAIVRVATIIVVTLIESKGKL